MSSYVYMKVLESAPHRYDRGMRLMTGGRIAAVYARIAALAAAPGARVLDVGCGTGAVALACAARGAEVLGLDPNAEMLEAARAKPAPQAGSTRWLQASAAEIEDHVEPHTLDAAVSCLAFSELGAAERRYSLKTLSTRLKPGATLVVADEVLPTGAAARAWYRARRAPVAAWTWLLTQTSTGALDDLAGEVAGAGFEILGVETGLARDLQLVHARNPQRELR